jgi:hypothetical protein
MIDYSRQMILRDSDIAVRATAVQVAVGGAVVVVGCCVVDLNVVERVELGFVVDLAAVVVILLDGVVAVVFFAVVVFLFGLRVVVVTGFKVVVVLTVDDVVVVFLVGGPGGLGCPGAFGGPGGGANCFAQTQANY